MKRTHQKIMWRPEMKMYVSLTTTSSFYIYS